METPKLFLTPIKQEAWYKQIREEIAISKRPIDKMSVAEISKMHDEQKFLCDTCGKELGKSDVSVKDHVLHLINPSIWWCCEDCYQSDLRNDRIIAMEEERSESWQEQNK